MEKEIKDKSDVVCNFYQSAEDIPDPRELSSEKNNLMVFDDLKDKTPVNRMMSEADTATLMFLFSLKLFQAPTQNNQRERVFLMSVSPRPEEH